MDVTYKVDDVNLSADDFLKLFLRNWPVTLDAALVQEAIDRTINITAWAEGSLVGCIRLLTDGYLATAVADLITHPQHVSITRRLMELAEEASPTSLMLGVHPADPKFMASLGWQTGPQCYFKRKPIPQEPWRRENKT